LEDENIPAPTTNNLSKLQEVPESTADELHAFLQN
jgi:hypothetical protein